MVFKSIFAIVVISFALTASALCQIEAEGEPRSFSVALKSNLTTVKMGAVDVEALLKEDEIEEEEGLPFRFGAPFDVDYNTENSGQWEELDDGSRIWRLRISSPGAYSINLLYSRYVLPPGATLHIYSDDKSHTIGAFTAGNNKDHGRFATSPVKGDVSIVEYYEPADVRGKGEVAINRIVHAYKDIFRFFAKAGGFGGSGDCNNNVNCPEAVDWQDDKRGVAMVLLGDGTRWCSGSLINNVQLDETPYFLTAFHCLGGESTWIIMFNYESPSCENPLVEPLINMTVSGTTLSASYETSDFVLVELSQKPPESYEPYYNGWSKVDVAATSVVGIHHPSGDMKKISWDYDAVTSTDFNSTTGTTHWRVEAWDDGTTERGSSGSALFDPQHRIVGQLSGGLAACGWLYSDWYGKFALSWTGDGTDETRLSNWLDPDNTGASVLDGWEPYDPDGDGLRNLVDNCPTTYNPSQLDWDSDGIGNDCECPGDPYQCCAEGWPDRVAGDVNNDGSCNVGDVVYMINLIFKGGPEPIPFWMAGDVNEDGGVNLGDQVYLLNYVFKGGPAPLNGCGESPPRLDLPHHTLSGPAAVGDLNSSFDGAGTIIKINSTIDLMAIQLEVECDDGAVISDLTPDLQKFSSQSDGVARVGLLDLKGQGRITAGVTSILTVSGEARVIAAIGVDEDGHTVPISVERLQSGSIVPETYSLSQNYPNPFNPQTEISFGLPTASQVKLEIFNTLGQKVATLVNGHLEAGNHSYVWDGGDVASGVYLYRFQADDYSATRKMVLMK